ncbi:hypothetical protein [Brevibacillus thermoruber]|uniref:hypothetical protein n=1 Tax=Brevibacillus thermoruber TaxID=33942 RepID=UPI00068DD500|nr:hypothetical protein [Brevibacillus thermoruber]
MLQIDLSLYDATLIPAMIFLLWIAVQLGLPQKFVPLVALGLGVALGLSFIGMNGNGLITGIFLAATAIGFHSGTKNTKEAFTKSV